MLAKNAIDESVNVLRCRKDIAEDLINKLKSNNEVKIVSSNQSKENDFNQENNVFVGDLQGLLSTESTYDIKTFSFDKPVHLLQIPIEPQSSDEQSFPKQNEHVVARILAELHNFNHVTKSVVKLSSFLNSINLHFENCLFNLPSTAGEQEIIEALPLITDLNDFYYGALNEFSLLSAVGTELMVKLQRHNIFLFISDEAYCELRFLVLPMYEIAELFFNFKSFFEKFRLSAATTVEQLENISLCTAEHVLKLSANAIDWQPLKQWTKHASVSRVLVKYLLSHSFTAMQLLRYIFIIRPPVSESPNHLFFYRNLNNWCEESSITQKFAMRFAYSKLKETVLKLYLLMHKNVTWTDLSIVHTLNHSHRFHSNIKLFIDEVYGENPFKIGIIELNQFMKLVEAHQIFVEENEEDAFSIFEIYKPLATKQQALVSEFNTNIPYLNSLVRQCVEDKISIKAIRAEMRDSWLVTLVFSFALITSLPKSISEDIEAKREIKVSISEADVEVTSYILFIGTQFLSLNPVARLRQLYQLCTAYTKFELQLYMSEATFDDNITLESLIVRFLVFRNDKFECQRLCLMQ